MDFIVPHTVLQGVIFSGSIFALESILRLQSHRHQFVQSMELQLKAQAHTQTPYNRAKTIAQLTQV